MNKIEKVGKCKSCGGTGLYSGIAEGKGAAVVCFDCKGEGKRTYVLEWEEFDKRKNKKGVRRVFQAGMGIGVGEDNGYKLEDFGGISYKDWKNGKPFPAGSEMRNFVCPAWWFQSVDYEKKPEWDECIKYGSFRHCNKFIKKHKCWERWDKENKK